jgi:hypothetical protein
MMMMRMMVLPLPSSPALSPVVPSASLPIAI